MITFKRGWCKPSTILFATECPVNERNFSIALAHAKEAGAKLILLHVSPHSAQTRMHNVTVNSLHRREAPSPEQSLEPLAERARDLNIDCQLAVREGSAADEILNCIKAWHVDRVVMGVHTAGPVGKLLVGSVAETLLRKADIPVALGGPYVVGGTYRNLLTRTILCSVNARRYSKVTIHFACELAAQYGAHLILQHVVPPQKKSEMAGCQSLDQMQRRILGMISPRTLAKVKVHADVTIGDPAEELLRRGRALRANAIVMDALEATHFAAESNAGALYKVLAYASCPVIALSPMVLAGVGLEPEMHRSCDANFMAGVI